MLEAYILHSNAQSHFALPSEWKSTLNSFKASLKQDSDKDSVSGE
ncbi:MAG: hypothetical protein ACRESZ_15100 [Methylococcales bacterium]